MSGRPGEVMNVTIAGAVDRDADVFADILCADQEWVDLEFEEIIDGLRPTPRSGFAPARPPCGGQSRFEIHPRRLGSRWIGRSRPRSSIRSPPSGPPADLAHDTTEE